MRGIRTAIFALMLVATGQSESMGMAGKPSDLSLIVMPSRYSVVQLSFDMLKKRQVVLLAYQGNQANDITMHVWNGKEWVKLAYADYQAGTFLQRKPNQIILVGGDELLPPSLINDSAWCDQVWRVPSIDTANMVNSYGKLFKFRQSEWKWFSDRYSLDLKDTNEKIRKDSWYSHPFVDDAPRRRVKPFNDAESVRPNRDFEIKPAILEEQDSIY